MGTRKVTPIRVYFSEQQLTIYQLVQVGLIGHRNDALRFELFNIDGFLFRKSVALGYDTYDSLGI